MPKRRTIQLVGGPKHGQKITMHISTNRLQLPITGLGPELFNHATYIHYKDDIFVYDDRKERVRTIGQTVVPCLTREESEERIRREITDFLEREGCERYEVLQETFEMTEYGFRGRVEIYIHRGKALEK